MMSDETQANKKILTKAPSNSFWSWKKLICWEAFIAIPTIALAIFTALLWWDTHKMVDSAEKTEARQHEDTIKSFELTQQVANSTISVAIATQKLAEAATTQAKNSEIMSKITIDAARPLVSFRFGLTPFRANTPFVLTPYIHNSGGSSAINLRVRITGEWKSNSNLQKTNLDQINSGALTPLLISGESKEIASFGIREGEMTKEKFTSIENRVETFQINARVDYFDSAKRHFSNSECLYYEGRLDKFSPCPE